MSKVAETYDKLHSALSSNDPNLLHDKLISSIKRPSTNIMGQSVIDYGQDVSNNDYLGDSFTYMSPYDVDEVRATAQPWLHKASRGLARVGYETLLNVADAGAMLGFGVANIFNPESYTGSGWIDQTINNPLSKAFEDAKEHINTEVLPVYIKQSIKNGNLFENLASIDFWATEGASGIAFMTSALMPGLGLSKLGTGAKLARGLANTTQKLTKAKNTFQAFKKLDNAVKAISGGSARLTPRQLSNNLDLLQSTVVNTIFEAGVEARGVGDSIRQQAEQLYNSGQISKKRYDELIAGIPEQQAKTFYSNTALLLGPNFYANKILLGRFKPKNVTNKFKVKDGKVIAETADMTTKQKALKSLGNVTKTFGKNLSREGFVEEAGQMVFEKTFGEQYVTGEDKSLAETYLDVVMSTEGQKAIALGGILGSGMQSISNVYNKVSGQQKEYQNKVSKALTQSLDFFETAKKGIYDENGNVNPDAVAKLGDSLDAYKKMELEIASIKDPKERKFAQEQYDNYVLQNLLGSFAKLGDEGIALLRNHLENSVGIDKTLEQINEDREIPLTKEDYISDLIQEAELLKDDIQFFQDYANLIPNLSEMENSTNDRLKEFENKISNQYALANSNLRFLEKKIQKTENALEKMWDNYFKRYPTAKPENKNNPDKGTKVIKETKKDLEFFKVQEEVFLDRMSEVQEQEWLEKEYKKYISQENKKEESKKDEKDLDSLFDKINTITDFKELEKVKDSKLYNKYKSQLNKKIAKRKMAINQIKKKEAEEANKTSKESKEENDNKNLALEESIEYLKNNYEKGQPLNLNDEGLKALLEEYEAQAEANNMSIYDFKEIIYLGINEKTGQPDFKFVETGETFTVKPPVSTNTDTDEFTDLEGSDIDEEIDHNEKEGSDQKDIDKDKKKFKNKDKGYDHKVMSTYEDGNPIPNIPQAFIDYQYSSEDKSDDIFTFEVNTNRESFKGAPKEIEINQALDDFEAGKYTDTVLHYLPIKMKVNGSNEIYTFLDTPNLQGSDAHLNNYKNRTLRLRQSIIEVLKNGDSLEDYYVTIVGQAKGKLLMDKKGSLNKIREIQQLKNTPVTDIEVYYVNKLGQVISLDGDIANISNGDISNWKGSIFIKLKRPNGQDFFLKTNFRKINEAEADIIFDLNAFVLKGRKKGEDPAAYRLSDLPNDLKEKLKDFQTEIDLIKKITEIEPTVAELLNLLYFENSTSIKSRIMRSSKNNFVYGSTQNGGRNIDFTTLSEENYNKEKDRFKFWATKNKNRNVKVKDQRNETAPGINLGNKHYKEYMFDNLIFTDAITDATDGKPSFGGFANIYVSNTLSKKAKKTKATPKNPVPLTPTSNNGPGTNTFTNKSSNKSIKKQKAYIERRREEELTTLNVGDSYDVISSTGSFDGTWKVVEITDKFYRMTNEAGGKLNMLKSRVEENLKRPDGVTKTKYRKSNREEINAKYDAEYVDAVKKGEMTKEQAMQALEEVGRKDSDAYKELASLQQPTSTTQTVEQQRQSTTNKPVNKNNTMSIINNMLNDTKPETVTITNKEGVEESVYEKDGKIYERQSNYVTRNVKDFDSIRNDNMEAGATIGNLIDILARDIFGSKELLSQEEYIAITNRISDFDLGITKEAYDKLIDEITKVKDELTKKGFTFVSNDFFVYEEFSDEVKKQTGKDGVAGTLDLLVLDKKGNIHIVDFKSNRINNASELDIKTGDYFSNNFNNKVNNKVIKWSSQQSVYKNLTEKFGLTVKSINILPFASSYEKYDNKTMFINNVELMMPKVEKDKILRSPISDKLIKLEENNFILNKLNKDTEKSTKKVLSSQKKIVPLHEQNDTKKSKKEILADLKQQVKKGSRAYNAIQAMEKGAKFTPAMKKFFTQEQINIIKNCK